LRIKLTREKPENHQKKSEIVPKINNKNLHNLSVNPNHNRTNQSSIINNNSSNLIRMKNMNLISFRNLKICLEGDEFKKSKVTLKRIELSRPLM